MFSIVTADEVAGTIAGDGLSGSVSDTAGRPVAVSTSAGQLEDLRRVSQPSGVPGGVNFPNGFFAFNVTGLARAAARR